MASTDSEAAPSTSAPPTRRGYKGSCHCGKTQYLAYITLPPPIIHATDRSTTRIRKCNCSTCHKMNFFHVRLINEPEDFLLLAPKDPFKELLDYTCFESRIHWFFCGTCGVRCFAFAGEGEMREVEIDGEKKTVWAPKKEGWTSKPGLHYITVNGVTIEPGQEGFDMREWSEKGWIAYLDVKDEVGDPRLGIPHEGGMY